MKAGTQKISRPGKVGLTPEQAQVLAKSEQPIFLIGGGAIARLAAAAAVHRKMTGMDLDVECPHPDLSVLSPPARDEQGAQGTLSEHRLFPINFGGGDCGDVCHSVGMRIGNDAWQGVKLLSRPGDK